MRTPGTPEELERQRRRAVELLQAGHRPSRVADLLGVSRGAVSQWKKIYQRDGPEGLKAKPHPGPKPKLTPGQCRQLARLLLKGPGWHGYRTELWTLARVAEVIRRRFGVRYDPSGVWHVLRRMDWSCQKPQRRAREGNEEAVEKWRRRDWPRIKKRPTRRP
jgi:transposase